MKCPFPDCKKDGMIPPKKPYPQRPYGRCPHCKRMSRAAIHESGEVMSYHPTNLRALPDDERKRYRSWGVSPKRKREILARGYKSVQDFLDNG